MLHKSIFYWLLCSLVGFAIIRIVAMDKIVLSVALINNWPFIDHNMNLHISEHNFHGLIMHTGFE